MTHTPAEGPLPDDVDAVLDHLGPAAADHGHASHDVARARARRAQAMRLRKDGATYEQIAEVAGYSSRSGAYSAVMRGLRQTEVEAIQDLRALEASRLDADEMALRTIIANPQTATRHRIQAIDTRLRLTATRARLFGLNHADGIAERALQLEADKVRLMAVALGRALDAAGLDEEQRAQVTGVLLAELRAGEAPPPTYPSDPPTSEET